jgi:hypothetical protein
MMSTLSKTQTQLERELQMAEGKRRHKEEGWGNIALYKETPCTFRLTESSPKEIGKIVGAYSLDTGTIRAFHIVSQSGERHTISTNFVTPHSEPVRVRRMAYAKTF